MTNSKLEQLTAAREKASEKVVSAYNAFQDSLCKYRQASADDTGAKEAWAAVCEASIAHDNARDESRVAADAEWDYRKQRMNDFYNTGGKDKENAE